MFVALLLLRGVLAAATPRLVGQAEAVVVLVVFGVLLVAGLGVGLDLPVVALVALLFASVTLPIHGLLEVGSRFVPRFVLVCVGFPLGAVLALLEAPFVDPCPFVSALRGPFPTALLVLLVASFRFGLLLAVRLAAAVLLAALALLAVLALESPLSVELLRWVGALLTLPVLLSWLGLLAARRAASLAAEGAGGPLVSLPTTRLVGLLTPPSTLLPGHSALVLSALGPTLLVATLLGGALLLAAPLLLSALRSGALVLTALREPLLTLLAVLALLALELLAASLLALEALTAARRGLLPAALLSLLRLAILLGAAALWSLSTLLRAGSGRRTLLGLLAPELTPLLPGRLSLLLSLPWLRRVLPTRRWCLLSTRGSPLLST